MLSNVVVLLLSVLPVAVLTSSSLPSPIFYALIFTSIVLLIKVRFAGAREQTFRYSWLIASYAALFLAVAFSSLYHGAWAGANSEGALRFFLGLWVLLLALPHIHYHFRLLPVWGVYAAGAISTIILLWLIRYVEARPLTP